MNIKAFIALIIAIAGIFTFTACNNKSADSKQKTAETITENSIAETDPQQAQGQTWQLGDNITATLSGETLTVSGSGAIEGEGEFTEYGDYFITYPWPNEITSVIIGNGIAEIGEGAFGGLSLTSVTLPNSVTVIGMLAFADNKLTNISFGNNVTHISHEAFARNNLTSVTIPNSVIKIGWSAFDDNPLTSITIGANVELDERVSFENGFDSAYNDNGKKAGIYTLNNGVWSLAGSVAKTGYKIGDIGPAGGLVFYDKGQPTEGWRYLEAAPEAYEFTAFWGFEGTEVAGTGTGIGSGKRNTDIMVQLLSAMLDGRVSPGKKNTEEAGSNRELTNNAAYKCSKLEINGFKDWFLPSKDELNLMYSALHSKNMGAFKDNYYWSSSVWYEENNHLFNSKYNTWIQTFSGGYHDYIGYEGAERENQELLVRAIRAF